MIMVPKQSSIVCVKSYIAMWMTVTRYCIQLKQSIKYLFNDCIRLVDNTLDPLRPISSKYFV